jgi:hypothetical protein
VRLGAEAVEDAGKLERDEAGADARDLLVFGLVWCRLIVLKVVCSSFGA